MARKKTKFTGVYYRETTTNDKLDKTYYIRYKDTNNKDVEIKIGKFSEGIREQYCNLKRNEILTKLRLGEEVHLKHRQKDKIFLKDIQLFKKEKLETPLAPKTVNNILALLGTIIRFGINEELLKNDISKFIKKDTIDNDRERFLTVEEIKKLYKEVEHDKRLSTAELK